MLLPRLAAVAEVGWAPRRRNYDDFLRRMEHLRLLYGACGYRYAPHPFAH